MGTSRTAPPSDASAGDLLTVYLYARVAIGATGTVVAAAIGSLTGWPRGWMTLAVVTTFTAVAIAAARRRPRPVPVLLFDSGLIAAITALLGLTTLTLIGFTLAAIIALVLIPPRAAWRVWVIQAAMIVTAAAIVGAAGLPAYSQEQYELTETAGTALFAAAIIGLLTAVVSKLRTTEDRWVSVLDRLRARDRRTAILLENAFEGVAVVDASGRVVFTGPNNERLTGFPAHRRTGGGMLDLIVEDDRSLAASSVARVLRDPTHVETFRARIRRADGDVRTIEVVLSNRLTDPHVEGLVSNFRDVTDHAPSRTSEAAAEPARLDARAS